MLVLIDPPFEKADDYERIVDTLAALRAKNAAAQALVWLPIKDLETLDSFLRDLEDEVAAPMLVAETPDEAAERSDEDERLRAGAGGRART